MGVNVTGRREKQRVGQGRRGTNIRWSPTAIHWRNTTVAFTAEELWGPTGRGRRLTALEEGGYSCAEDTMFDRSGSRTAHPAAPNAAHSIRCPHSVHVAGSRRVGRHPHAGPSRGPGGPVSGSSHAVHIHEREDVRRTDHRSLPSSCSPVPGPKDRFTASGQRGDLVNVGGAPDSQSTEHHSG